MAKDRPLALWCAVLAVLLSAPALAIGQELEPRAYSPSPVGVNFLSVSGGRSQGSVLLDPSIALEDVSATVETLTIAYGRTFDLAGRQALIVGAIPLAWSEATGRVGENRGSVGRTGFADVHIKVSAGLAGAPALTAAEFRRAPRRPTVGASLTVVAPTGQYDSRKLINLGTNRWGFKPEIGVSYPRHRWTFDVYAGIWMITTNDTFYPGSSRRTQDNTTTLQAHVSYEIARQGWIAVDSTWYSGGQSAVNGVAKDDRKRNTRVGGTFSLPIRPAHSIKLSYSTGASTRAGTDFETFGISWQIIVF